MFGIAQLAALWDRMWKRQPATPHAAPQTLGTSPAAPQRIATEVAASEAEVPQGVTALDDKIKRRMKDLGDAINQSLSESEPIADAIANIKAQGYDVFLVLEATVGFTKQGEDDDSEAADADNGSLVGTRARGAEPKLRMTPQDMKFLKSMRIGLGD